MVSKNVVKAGLIGLGLVGSVAASYALVRNFGSKELQEAVPEEILVDGVDAKTESQSKKGYYTYDAEAISAE